MIADEMVWWVRDNATDRKKRLFAVAAFRQFWDVVLLMAFPAWLIEVQARVPNAIRAAEAFADGRCGRREMTVQWNGLSGGPHNIARHIGRSRAADTLRVFRAARSCWAELGAPEVSYEKIVRDCFVEVFGDLVRRPPLDARWRTADVLGVAHAIYDDGAFDRLPVLADALMDAGCEDEAMIAHCRSAGPHVRGCWVVDLVLGKD